MGRRNGGPNGLPFLQIKEKSVLFLREIVLFLQRYGILKEKLVE